MRKAWKTYQSKPCIFQEMFLRSVEQWRRLIQPCGTNLVSKVEDITRKSSRRPFWSWVLWVQRGEYTSAEWTVAEKKWSLHLD